MGTPLITSTNSPIVRTSILIIIIITTTTKSRNRRIWKCRSHANNKLIVGAPYTAVRGKGEYVILKFGAVFIYYKQNVLEEVDLQEKKEEKEDLQNLQNLQDDISKGNDSPPPLIPNNSENNSN